MAVIWKWRLEKMVNEIEVPKGTTFLSVGWDPKIGPCVWGFVPDKEAQTIKRRLHMVGTGMSFPEFKAEFRGTIICLDSGLVFHAFEEAI